MVSSQIDEHKKFGGVVPELAARAHLENIDFIINKSLNFDHLINLSNWIVNKSLNLIILITTRINL